MLLTLVAFGAAGAAFMWAHQTRYQIMFFGVAVVLFVAAEFIIGWWALPVVGAILGVVGAHRKGAVPMIAGAAVLAWGVLFAWTATHGSLPAFLDSLAASMKLKPGHLLSAATAIPALLAGPAARLGAALRPAPQAADVPIAATSST
jgi:hypothetical protein